MRKRDAKKRCKQIYEIEERLSKREFEEFLLYFNLLGIQEKKSIIAIIKSFIETYKENCA